MLKSGPLGGAVLFFAVMASPVFLYPAMADSLESGPILVSKVLGKPTGSGRKLNLVVREKTSRFRDGDLLHVFLDGSPIESMAPRDGLFSISIPHLSGDPHRVSLRFSRKNQTEWGSELLIVVPPDTSSVPGGMP